MRSIPRRGRIALAGVLAASAIGSATAAPAEAHKRPVDCGARLERIESTFRVIEARFGYDLASRWWNDIAWPHYYRHCPGA
jgi:hypothetical protein